MSYAIYIGRNHTADGIAYLAGYGDEPSSHWCEVVPRTRHAEGATITVGVGLEADMPGLRTEIPQVAETARNMRVNYSHFLGVPAPITNGGLNEHGVAVRDVWSPSRKELVEMTPVDQTGLNYSDLARVVLERARTASEGVDIIGAMIDEYGYACYGGNSHLIADPEEAWVVIQFSGGRKLWVAERLGVDDIRASRPGYVGTIPGEPDERFRFPTHFIATAIELGWYDAASGRFDVNAVYGDGKGRWRGVAWIEAEMRQRATRAGKIALADVFWAISTARLTGDTAGYGQVVPLVHPRHDALRTMWHAPVGPVTAPLVPMFLGQSGMPDEFARHRYLTAGEDHRFLDMRKEDEDPDAVSSVPQGVEVADSAVYQFKRLMHLAFQDAAILEETAAHWRRLESALAADLPDVLRSAEILIDAGEPRLAERLLTEANRSWLGEALADCHALVDSAHARLRRAGRLNRTERHMSPPQLW